MTKASACVHSVLTGYLWLISWVSLGRWNAQPDLHLLAAMRAGHSPGAGDLILLAFVTLPMLLVWASILVRVWRHSVWLIVSALVFDFIWLALQAESWWVPYFYGNPKPWQIAYAQGPTLKVLPSFGRHVAPDGMHLLIAVFLVAAICTALLAVRSSRPEAGRNGL